MIENTYGVFREEYGKIQGLIAKQVVDLGT